jgi:aryl-phospho-beta-D-glucosidase BglC (GH1 family)
MKFLRGLSTLAAAATTLWSTKENKVFFKDEEYLIKGVNFQGLEFSTMSPCCMYVHNMDYYIDFLVDNNFNSIRLPFSYELTRNLDHQVPYPTTLSADPDLQYKSIREIMHTLIGKCHDRGISVLLDFHNINSVITELPWTFEVPEDELILAWDRMMEFANYTNVIGVDIKNEPHNIGWDVWGGFVNKFMVHVQEVYPWFQGLYFVEGLNDKTSPWAGSFGDMPQDAITDKSKVVWSPHAYGPSVRGKVALDEGADQFYAWFGFLKNKYPNAIVLGEFGGFMTSSDFDLEWHYRLRSFLIDQDITSSFFWVMFPDSKDTGGLFLTDCVSINYDKLHYLNSLNPTPTKVDFRGT